MDMPARLEPALATLSAAPPPQAGPASSASRALIFVIFYFFKKSLGSVQPWLPGRPRILPSMEKGQCFSLMLRLQDGPSMAGAGVSLIRWFRAGRGRGPPVQLAPPPDPCLPALPLAHGGKSDTPRAQPSGRVSAPAGARWPTSNQKSSGN